MDNNMEDLIVDIKSPKAADGRLTGGKGSSLAKLIKIVGEENVPTAKIVTTMFSTILLEDERLLKLVRDLDRKLSEAEEEKAEEITNKIRKTIESMHLPRKLSYALNLMREEFKKDTAKGRIAIRSSGIVEDLPAAAFAGQYETFLNISVDGDLAQYVLRCIASAFGWRVVDYRWNLRKRDILKKSEEELLSEGLIAVILQTMVDADKAGVAFSIDPDTGNKNVGVIQAIYGLGELIVQGTENASWTAFTKKPRVETLGTVTPENPQKYKLVYNPETRENQVVEVGSHDARVLTRGGS